MDNDEGRNGRCFRPHTREFAENVSGDKYKKMFSPMPTNTPEETSEALKSIRKREREREARERKQKGTFEFQRKAI